MASITRTLMLVSITVLPIMIGPTKLPLGARKGLSCSSTNSETPRRTRLLQSNSEEWSNKT